VSVPAPGALRRVLVIGAGGWGTALALLAQRKGLETTLWCRDPAQAAEIARTRENKRYLPGIALPAELRVLADPLEAARSAELAISAVPTQYLRATMTSFQEVLPGSLPIVSATKGIEIESFRTPARILRDVLGERPICVLTGPTHAEEVSRGLPASVVAASRDAAFARLVQAQLSGDSFRIYTHHDPDGAELAGALKNVIAIAAGICEGLELGDNARSALIARGMVEMARFGAMQGAEPQTFFGLAGLGDLITTCCSRHSRNRAVGQRIGRGETLAQVLAGMQMVAEGVWTTQALFGPESESRAAGMPIAQQVYSVLFESQDPGRAVRALMQREPTGEMDGLFRERR